MSVYDIKLQYFFNFRIVFLSWLGFIGFDLFLHAGLLAFLYHEDSPAILSPLDSFYRIPIGYLALFLYCMLLYWLIVLFNVTSTNEIIKFSALIGLFLSLISTFAQFSIININTLLLLGWGIGLIIEFILSGFIIALCLSGYPFKRLLIYVLLFDLVLFLVTVIMQSIGLAPPQQIAFRSM